MTCQNHSALLIGDAWRRYCTLFVALSKLSIKGVCPTSRCKESQEPPLSLDLTTWAHSGMRFCGTLHVPFLSSNVKLPQSVHLCTKSVLEKQGGIGEPHTPHIRIPVLRLIEARSWHCTPNFSGSVSISWQNLPLELSTKHALKRWLASGSRKLYMAHGPFRRDG